MARFILKVLKDLQNNSVDISKTTFILPNKRAGYFLMNEYANLAEKPVFAPSVKSIEEFVQELSHLNKINPVELLFEFYKIYLEHSDKDQVDSFDLFSKWAPILLQDFNEIDRNLVDPEPILNYLSDIKKTESWTLGEEQTPLIKKHLAFWNKLMSFYDALTESLLAKEMGYQGLIYREAVENLESYIQNNDKLHVFIGFNALNRSEELIIQELLQNDMSKIYWDIDKVFIEDELHEAGYFIRRYQKWNYYHNHPFNWPSNFYQKKKSISVVGVPKNVGQVKYISELLLKQAGKEIKLDDAAVILGDERLLMPLLNSIPGNVQDINITMGYPLRAVPAVALFESLFEMHSGKPSSFYHKSVIAVVTHQLIVPLLKTDGLDSSTAIISEIQNNNLVYLTKKKLVEFSPAHAPLLECLFSSWNDDVSVAITHCREIIFLLKEELNKNKALHKVALEQLYRINKVFNVLDELTKIYPYVNSIKVLNRLFKEIVRTETLSFEGEPLKGLQVMGMLESRVLDFETIIITSVNESILPFGKGAPSFIPFDVKLEYQLPTYKEKDAVFAYHFYRLIQHAKNVYLIYNTEQDNLGGGEKSRYITQLEVEELHDLKHILASPSVPRIDKKPLVIGKTKQLIKKLHELGQSGLSPSSLSLYIRNPIDFYFRYILGEKDDLFDVEETIASKTLGIVVHETLKELYSPFLNQLLTADHLLKTKKLIPQEVEQQFSLVYKQGDIRQGKNLIIFEIAKRYVSNFMDMEIALLDKGHRIKLMQLEINVEQSIAVEDLPFPIKLKGQVDRIDEFDGTVRIIDYKTGKVDPSQVQLVNWEEITTDYKKYSKSFQVLLYAFILSQTPSFKLPLEAGIISFKNLQKGFMKFGKRENFNSRNKDSLITQEVMDRFSTELKKLIREICNPDIAFIEKEIDSF